MAMGNKTMKPAPSSREPSQHAARCRWVVLGSGILVLIGLSLGSASSLCAEAPGTSRDAKPGADHWPRYGGPRADFTVESGRLAESWPEGGPPRLWEGSIGGGYAGLVSDGDRLYTMSRIPSDQIDGREDGEGREVVTAIDPATGVAIWEHSYEAPVDPADPSHDLRYGRGPSSTPLWVDGKLYTLGFTGMLHCLSAQTGKVIWAHDLWRRFKVEVPYYGHASSPIPHESSLIVLAGGAMAFDLATGELSWDNWEIEASYASPRMIRVGDREQILAPLSGEVAGLDPASGKVLWRHEHANQYKTILSSPVVGDGGLVFISTAWVGSRGLRIGVEGPGVKELWHNPKMQVAHSNAVRVGDWIYASSGVEVDFLTAIHIETGEIAWKERGLTHVNLLHADGRFILLDESGQLILATLTPEKATVHQRAQILDSRSWTAPTLIGTRLYVRNQQKMLALELGRAVESSASTTVKSR